MPRWAGAARSCPSERVGARPIDQLQQSGGIGKEAGEDVWGVVDARGAARARPRRATATATATDTTTRRRSRIRSVPMSAPVAVPAVWPLTRGHSTHRDGGETAPPDAWGPPSQGGRRATTSSCPQPDTVRSRPCTPRDVPAGSGLATCSPAATRSSGATRRSAPSTSRGASSPLSSAKTSRSTSCRGSRSRSRLAQSSAATVTLRTAIVLGSGSMSSEVVRQISERLPLVRSSRRG